MLFQLFGAPILFAANGVEYLLSGISESFMHFRGRVGEAAERSILAEFREGFDYVWRRPGFRRLLVTFTLFQFAQGPFYVLMPFYVEDTLGLASRWFGFLIAGAGAGAIVGYALAGVLNPQGERRSGLYILSVLFEGLCFAALGLVGTRYGALVLIVAVGIMQGFHNIVAISLIQATTPSEIRGRVVGFVSAVVAGATPIAMGLAGIVADALERNIPAIFVTCGLTGALISLALLERRTRSFLAS